MKRGWIAGAAILGLLLGAAEVIWHLRSDDLASEVAAVCVLLVAMAACYRVAKWADNTPRPEVLAVQTPAPTPLADTSTPSESEPTELLQELQSLGYVVQRDADRWKVTDLNRTISLYFSSNAALMGDADALRRRASTNQTLKK